MNERVWSWPLAGYLFLGGLGAGMTMITAVADVFFGVGILLGLAPLVAFFALSLGCLLLIFELGVPRRFWRVFHWHGAVLNFGAWAVGILIVLDALYFSFFNGWFPWSGFEVPRIVLAVCAFAVATGVLIYTGIELSSLKGRVFWNTPALPILFAVSGLLTGAAADWLCLGVWPAIPAFFFGGVDLILLVTCVVLDLFTLMSILVYVATMRLSSDVFARVAANRLISGSYSKPFWVGLIAIGLVVPLVLYFVGGPGAAIAANICVLIGGVFLRFLIVFSHDRRTLPGESDYYEFLPTEDEPFMKSDWE